MSDAECTSFLKWALPRLRLRWPGFRKVRGQLCKRLSRRLKELRLRDTPSYRRYLEAHPDEWAVLDKLSTVTISRFYRDKTVFDYLRLEVLPDLAERALAKGEGELVLLSAGCASGEEPYTLSLIVELSLASRMQAIRPGFPYRIIASDVDEYLLGRARRGCYPASSLKDLPVAWRERAFYQANGEYCLKERFRSSVVFLQQDIRQELPAEHFHLILCRNLVFTYFEEALQREVLAKLIERLYPDGVLVIGQKETLSEGHQGLAPLVGDLGIYRKATT